jgi:hypothetical protein
MDESETLSRSCEAYLVGIISSLITILEFISSKLDYSSIVRILEHPDLSLVHAHFRQGAGTFLNNALFHSTKSILV